MTSQWYYLKIVVVLVSVALPAIYLIQGEENTGSSIEVPEDFDKVDFEISRFGDSIKETIVAKKGRESVKITAYRGVDNSTANDISRYIEQELTPRNEGVRPYYSSRPRKIECGRSVSNLKSESELKGESYSLYSLYTDGSTLKFCSKKGYLKTDIYVFYCGEDKVMYRVRYDYPLVDSPSLKTSELVRC